jgi:hypothetical protein
VDRSAPLHLSLPGIVRSISSLMLAVFLTSALQAQCDPAPPAQNGSKNKSAPDKVALCLVIQAIEDALTDSANHPVQNFPSLKSVTVSVNTTISKNINGKVTLFVFNVGGSGTVDNTSTLTFQMKPPPAPKPGANVQSVNPEEIKNALVKQIQVAKVGFLESSQVPNSSLKTNDVQVEISFSTTKEFSGGVDTAKILPIGISAGGKLDLKSGNTIKLDFSQDDK